MLLRHDDASAGDDVDCDVVADGDDIRFRFSDVMTLEQRYNVTRPSAASVVCH